MATILATYIVVLLLSLLGVWAGPVDRADGHFAGMPRPMPIWEVIGVEYVDNWLNRRRMQICWPLYGGELALITAAFAVLGARAAGTRRTSRLRA